MGKSPSSFVHNLVGVLPAQPQRKALVSLWLHLLNIFRKFRCALFYEMEMEKNWSTFLAYVFCTVGGMLLIHGISAFLELDVGPEVTMRF